MIETPQHTGGGTHLRYTEGEGMAVSDTESILRLASACKFLLPLNTLRLL